MSSQNSTIVRLIPAAVRTASRVMPDTTAKVLSRLFFRTPPRRQPSRRDGVPPSEPRTWPEAGLVGEAWAGATPEAPVVLLVHGWGGRRTQLSSFVAPLRAAGFAVLAFDAPGHGDSTGSSLSLPRFAAAIRVVAATVPSVHAIVAHSFGGPAAALAIRDGLDVPHLVTIGAPADPTRWFRAFCTMLGVDARLRPRVQAAIETHVGLPMTALAIERIGPALATSTLVIHDDEDTEVEVADHARLVAATPGATAFVTHGLGHRKILRDRRVIEEVVRFLGGAPPLHCRSCGGQIDDDPAQPLCLSCGVEAMLAHRDRRHPPAA